MKRSYRDNTVDRNKKKKKKKTQKEQINSNITQFEDLANEILYEIFDYLEFYHMYLAFSNLNIRFESFLLQWTVPIQLNPSILSKSAFDYYHKNTIIHKQYQIKSLSLSNSFVVNLMFKAYSFPLLSNYSQLQTLILNNIEKRHVINILKSLRTLPNLHSLTILCHEKSKNPVKYFLELFQLPVLKYCRVKFETYSVHSLFRLLDDSDSSIEHLIIDSNIWIANLNSLLSGKSKLRYLTVNQLCGNTYGPIMHCSRLKKPLTKLIITKLMISFEFFKSFIKTHGEHLEILHLSQMNDSHYFNANDWEQLIMSSMPNLKTFSVHFRFTIDNRPSLKLILRQFHTSFWLERQWFFEHNISTVSYKITVDFYSINPFSMKKFIIIGNNHQTFGKKVPLKSVNHVVIENTNAIINCRNTFPSATKLTLTCNDQDFSSLSTILRLEQLTTLHIKAFPNSFVFLIELLNIIPNIKTLIFDYYGDFSRKIELLSKTNQIKRLIISKQLSFEKIQFLIRLCPQLEYLRIEKYSDLRSILLFLLSNTRHLHFICIHDFTKSDFNRTLSMIKYNQLLKNFTMDFVSELRICYIWW
ncbi:hypothetical protein I4U23_023212 [Adineta vaga]|nr:hypothetical protein I4U23_023212 [Adineta vaga]